MCMTTSIPIIQRSLQYAGDIAIIDDTGSYTYQRLLKDAGAVASTLLHFQKPLQEQPVVFLVPPTYDYVRTQWGVWLSGAIAVPLAVNHPIAELSYVLKDTQSAFLVYHPMFEEKVHALAESFTITLIDITKIEERTISSIAFPQVESTQKAMMVYTSGTTGKPKGVVTTHDNITAHIEALTEAWHWSKEDRIVNILPLHHVHGIVNIVASALWNGARCYMLPKFDMEKVWDLVLDNALTLFMAVPTVYAKMIDHFNTLNTLEKEAFKNACRKMRLMVSGSAALPVSVLDIWKEISGHVLLERYGMTEIGMALSNSYTENRTPGHVGKPLPFVEVKVVDAQMKEVDRGVVGELLVKGPSVFKEYWQKPKATQEAFTEDGWFQTGDVVQENEEGIFKILGRQSVDIIKTGGYKVSALEIEEVLREYKHIVECAVVGLPSDEWGQEIAAAIVTKEALFHLDELIDWLQEQLAPYKKPVYWKVLDELPKNAMGKVMKPQIVKLFQ